MTPTLQFLTALFDYWPDPQLRLEIRCLSPKRIGGRPGPRRWFPLGETAAAAAFAEEMAPRFDVYHGVLPRVGEKGDQSSVTVYDWLWVDVDGGEAGPREAADLVRRSGLPAPNIALVSGSGCHCYWRLSDHPELITPADRDNLKTTLKRIVIAIGGTAPDAHADSARADCASILRPPGTFNHKTDPARPVKLIRFDLECGRHPYDWWRANLPAIPLPRLPAERESRSNPYPPRYCDDGARGNYYDPRHLPPWVEQWANTPTPDGERYREILRTAVRLKRDYHLSPDLILPALERKAEVSGSSHTSEDLEKMLRWA